MSPMLLPFFFLLGLLLGLLYFMALRLSVARMLEGGLAAFAALWLARAAVAVAALVAVAHAGAPPLLVTLGGILVARPICLRRALRSGP